MTRNPERSCRSGTSTASKNGLDCGKRSLNVTRNPVDRIVEKSSDRKAAAGYTTPNSDAAVTGIVVRVRGSVVDVEFSAGGLPALNEALVVECGAAFPLLMEVEDHLDPHTVRAVAMQNTAGLRRGATVRKTGGPISVPVGEKVLGRLINVIGEPIDELGVSRPTFRAGRFIGLRPSSAVRIRRTKCSRPESRLSICSRHWPRAARPVCSAAPAWARLFSLQS